MADEKKRRGPTDAQLAAAIQGARDMVESRRTASHEDTDPTARQRGGGGSIGGLGTAQGGSNSPSGTDHPTDPSAETGGPRGAGTSVSRTTGGRLTDADGAYGVEPDEAIKRETAVFKPGTQKKPELS